MFYNKIREDGVGERTILNYHNFLHGAFEYALRQEIFSANPMNRVERPTPKKFVGKFYSVEELRTLLALTESDPIYLPIVLAAYYGVRRSEAIGLSWSSVDFENKFIYIRQKVVDTRDKNGKPLLLISDEMKNESSRRTLPLIPEVEVILKRHREQQEEYRRLFKNDYCRDYLDMVCVNPTGQLLHPDYITGRFPTVLEKYNLRKIRYHDLRHSCASLLLAKDVNMKIIQMWLGHSSMKTTSDIYSHLEASSKDKAGEILESLLGIGDED